MARSGPGTFSARSFYESEPSVTDHVPNFGDSDKESVYDQDEANIPIEESDYSSFSWC